MAVNMITSLSWSASKELGNRNLSSELAVIGIVIRLIMCKAKMRMNSCKACGSWSLANLLPSTKKRVRPSSTLSENVRIILEVPTLKGRKRTSDNVYFGVRQIRMSF